MNILIINGSPRKKGLISQMLGIMRVADAWHHA